jgi:hypothetical protein
MNKNRICLLLSFLLLFGASPVVAAQSLLAEFTQHTNWLSLNGAIDGQLPPTVAFTFVLRDQPTNTELNWTQQLSLDDVDKAFSAPAAVIDPFSSIALQSDTRVELHIGPEPSSPVQFGSPAAPSPEVFDLPWSTLYVPDISAYRLTGIERIVDSVLNEWVPGAEGRDCYLGGAQRIRVYGLRVPEPSTLILFFISVCLLSLNWSRSCNSERH